MVDFYKVLIATGCQGCTIHYAGCLMVVVVVIVVQYIYIYIYTHYAGCMVDSPCSYNELYKSQPHLAYVCFVYL